ncbi:lipase 3-like [Adelges cooleyi]|uniref:lipase 3-like n=1 Tax=Adelges cooleyi TaxID=133065 RepID=UPI0021804CE9|nr:lipase 3-like [Adelges cooleyi]
MNLYFSICILYQLQFTTSTFFPDALLSVPKIIKRHNYNCETHIVKTEDGYLLEIHRIQKKQNIVRNHPVFLQHGILASSADWVIGGPKNALAYQLSDQGFDVWLGNLRGNTYSRSHISLDPESQEFWDFSFHEIGYYDVPATIDYILEQTNKEQLIYVGHSMGTCIFFVMCSTRPEYNDKIRTQISLAPIAFVNNMKSVLLNSLVPYADKINKIANLFTNGAFLPQNAASKLVSKYLCGENMANATLCKKFIVYEIFGEDPVEFNAELLPIILAHNPAGTSTKTLTHFAQEFISGNFQQYDYGSEGNIKKYNCVEPPLYSLSSVIAPVLFYHATNDLLSDPKDVMELYTRLPNRLGKHLINYERFNHVDFLYSRNVTRLLYRSVLSSIKHIDSSFWIPYFDRKTFFNNTIDYNRCEKKYKNEQSLWYKLMSYVRKTPELHPIISPDDNELGNKPNETMLNAWDHIFNE